MSPSTRGVRIGVDFGHARVGVARSDPDGLLATPVQTVAGGEGEAERVAAIVRDEHAVRVYVGLPLSLSGSEGKAAAGARDFAARLVSLLGATGPSVVLIDERNSTVEASRALHAAGRSAKRQRAVIDQQAAVVLLQHALDAERRGVPTGEPVRLSSNEL